MRPTRQVLFFLVIGAVALISSESAAQQRDASSPSIYTFAPTAYGTVEVFRNGKRISTGTPEFATQQYGYKPPTGTALPAKTPTTATQPALQPFRPSQQQLQARTDEALRQQQIQERAAETQRLQEQARVQTDSKTLTTGSSANAPLTNVYSMPDFRTAETTPITTQHGPLLRSIIQKTKKFEDKYKLGQTVIDSAAAAGSQLAPTNTVITGLKGGKLTADLLDAQQTDGTYGLIEKTYEKGFVNTSGQVGTALFGPVGGALAAGTAQMSYGIGKNIIAPKVAPPIGEALSKLDRRIGITPTGRAAKKSQEQVEILQRRVDIMRASKKAPTTPPPSAFYEESPRQVELGTKTLTTGFSANTPLTNVYNMPDLRTAGTTPQKTDCGTGCMAEKASAVPGNVVRNKFPGNGGKIFGAAIDAGVDSITGFVPFVAETSHQLREANQKDGALGVAEVVSNKVATDAGGLAGCGYGIASGSGCTAGSIGGAAVTGAAIETGKAINEASIGLYKDRREMRESQREAEELEKRLLEQNPDLLDKIHRPTEAAIAPPSAFYAEKLRQAGLGTKTLTMGSSANTPLTNVYIPDSRLAGTTPQVLLKRQNQANIFSDTNTQQSRMYENILKDYADGILKDYGLSVEEGDKISKFIHEAVGANTVTQKIFDNLYKRKAAELRALNQQLLEQRRRELQKGIPYGYQAPNLQQLKQPENSQVAAPPTPPPSAFYAGSSQAAPRTPYPARNQSPYSGIMNNIGSSQ